MIYQIIFCNFQDNYTSIFHLNVFKDFLKIIKIFIPISIHPHYQHKQTKLLFNYLQ